MMNYKFSVSMCVYNGDNAKYFDTAMQSVFEQTLPPNEVVLVVDGPVNAEINKAIEKYKSQYNKILKVIYSPENMGHGNARRLGMKNCTNDLIAIMDADDICEPSRFEKQINVFKSYDGVSVVGGLIKEFIGDTANVVGVRNVPEFDDDIKRYMQKRCPVNQVTAMLNIKDAEAAGGYIDWYCEEDYYLWMRMALQNKKFYNIQENLVYVRVGDEMYHRRGGIKYFKSEAKLQRYMLDKKIINISRYIINVSERFVIQVLMPNRLRGWVFKKLARNKENV